MEKKIPRDRNGTELSSGDFVKVFLDHSEKPDFTAKILFTGDEKSTLMTLEGGTINEPIDNKNLEIL